MMRGQPVGDTASATLNTLVNTGAERGADREHGHREGICRLRDVHHGRHGQRGRLLQPAEGLSEADAALISDVVRSQTDYPLSQVRIIEVKP